MGNGLDATEWAAGPSGRDVSISVRPGAGEAVSDRITLIWNLPNERLIKNTWLQVTVLPTEATGLTAPDVFYFGNLVGETGDGAGSLRVSALDLGAVKRALNSAPGVTSPFDFNRDGRVNALDLSTAKANLNRSLPLLHAAAPPQPVTNAAPPATPIFDRLRRVADDVL
jgi:hypothetical protein